MSMLKYMDATPMVATAYSPTLAPDGISLRMRTRAEILADEHGLANAAAKVAQDYFRAEGALIGRETLERETREHLEIVLGPRGAG